MFEACGGYVDEVALGAVTMLPIKSVTGSIRKTLQLAHGLCEHWSVIFLAYDPLTPLVLYQQRWG